MIRGDETVREISRTLPRATWVFERYGIDFCCGGKRALRDVCAEANLPLEQIISALEMEAKGTVEAAPEGATATELVDYILAQHHAFTREALGRATRLSEKVARVHGERHPELVEMRKLVVELDADLGPHLKKEEAVLFPYVLDLERGTVSRPGFGTAANPIRMMELEHERVGELLRSLRRVTRDYALPDDACGSYRALYEVLAELETDLHRHIHLENNVLFPKALALEEARS